MKITVSFIEYKEHEYILLLQAAEPNTHCRSCLKDGVMEIHTLAFTSRLSAFMSLNIKTLDTYSFNNPEDVLFLHFLLDSPAYGR